MAADQRLHGRAQQRVPSHQTQSSRLPFQRISDHHAVLYRRQAPLAPFLIPPKTAENPREAFGECAQLAGAFLRWRRFESGSKLRALQTLRAIRLRTGMSPLRTQCGCPEGTHDNSPALQCWGEGASRKYLSPGGTAEACASRMRLAPNQPSLRDSADPS